MLEIERLIERFGNASGFATILAIERAWWNMGGLALWITLCRHMIYPQVQKFEMRKTPRWCKCSSALGGVWCWRRAWGWRRGAMMVPGLGAVLAPGVGMALGVVLVLNAWM